jgi:hypothetical protein
VKPRRWFARDTNSLISPPRHYKRPGHDLCVPGHIPVTWLYRSWAASNALGLLTVEVCGKTLAELTEVAGCSPQYIQVRVQTVRFKKKVEPAEPKVIEDRPRIPLGPIATAWAQRRAEAREARPPAVANEKPPEERFEERVMMSWGLG